MSDKIKQGNSTGSIEQLLKELEKILDEYKQQSSKERTLTEQEYEEYLEEYDALLYEYQFSLKENETKENNKEKSKTKLDEINILILIYGLIQIFLCFPILMYDIIGISILGLYYKISPALYYSSALFRNLAFYTVPVLLMLISWTIYLNLKKKLDKITFLIVWGIQTALLIGGGIYIYVTFLRHLIAL